MRFEQIVFGLFLMMVLLEGVLAADPVAITLFTDTSWLVAGGKATASLEARVTDSIGQPVYSVNVRMWCEDPAMGAVTTRAEWQPADVNGKVYGTFTPGTKSGDAVIHAEVYGTSINTTAIQQIDHAEPKKWSLLSYPFTATVNSDVTITARLNDSYDNTVENRNVAESVRFLCSQGGFWTDSGYVTSLSAPVGLDGNATAKYRMPGTAATYVLQLTAPSTVLSNTQWITIKGKADGPAAILSQITPKNGQARASTSDSFTILYVVQDASGNPVPNVAFWRNTTPVGEADRFITNDEGIVITTYGPKNSMGIVDITASLESRPGVLVTDTVEFVPSDPVMWDLTASPQMLASRDVQEDIVADIKVKVIDILGDPVPGETITFSMAPSDYSANAPLTIPPTLVDTTALTDSDGFAIVQFRPGAFPLLGESGYDPYSTGQATVHAIWNGRTKEINLTFENYPYLRVTTAVSPQTVTINETVDVTIQIIGDGWALRPPVDVLLVTDRSGSMLKDEPEDRILPVMRASTAFTETMDISKSKDHVGLISFGTKGIAKIAPTPKADGSWDWSYIYGGKYSSDLEKSGWWYTGIDASYECDPSHYSSLSQHQLYVDAHYPGNPRNYEDYAIKEAPLHWNPSAITASINAMVPSGGTPMRYAVYKGIDEMRSHGRSNAIKALIVLSDGDYNLFGDPLARGFGNSNCYPNEYGGLATSYCIFSGLGSGQYSNQNMSLYAKNNDVVIYSVGYASDISRGGKDTLRILAESTGGKYFDGDAANIADIYRTIAGELMNVVANDVTMNLAGETLNVSYENVTAPLPGKKVFAYQYVPGISTSITSWNATVDPLRGHVPEYPYTENQIVQWQSTPPHLTFDIGTIGFTQTWQATFQFKALTPGSINIFGPGSMVQFKDTDMTNILTLPDTFITSIENITAEEETQALVDVHNLTASGAESETNNEILHVEWMLDYKGTERVKQDIFYQFSKDNVTWSNDWIYAGSNLTDYGPLPPNYRDTGDILIRDKMGWIRILVVAKEVAPAGAYDEEQTGPILVRVGGFIRIE